MIERVAAAVRLIGLLSVSVALVVLASWPLEWLVVRSLVVGGNDMKPITALGIGLAGLSLWLLGPRPAGAPIAPSRRQIGQAAALVTLLVGGTLLVEHLFRLDGSIGNLLFPTQLAATGVPTAGRPSLATAACLTLLGLGLLLIDLELRCRVRPSQLLALTVALLGLIGFEGYILGMEALFRFAAYSTMAVHTSLMFLLLGFGLLHARPDRGLMRIITSEGSGGMMARRVLPVAVLTPILLAWPRLQGERLGYYETEVGLAIFATSNIIIFTVVIWLSAQSLNRVDEARRLADLSTRAALTELEQESAERNRAEAAARASEERFAVAFQSSPAGMVLLGLPGLEYVAVNASWLAMTGLTEAEVIGKRPDDLDLVSPEQRNSLREKRGPSGVLRNEVLRFQTKLGEERHGLLSTQHVLVNGEPFMLATLVDITARVRTEAELRASNERLETTLADLRAAQQQIIEQERIGALGQLASGIAHDFNNALGPILGYSDLLLEEPELLDDRAETTEYLRAINTAAQGAASVVSRLRDFYRRRQNSDALTPAYLPDLIAQAISLTRPRWKDQAQANGAMIDVVAEVRDVPTIDGHPAELRDALVNLILNAVDALPTGGAITLRTRHEGEHVIVEVADNGAGMSEEIRRRCLEPFFTTKGERGTGLGLGIVHETLQRHGGTIAIESAPGLGSTFRLRLPARLSPERVAPGAVAPGEIRRSLRVLLVDDEPMMRQAVAQFLRIDEHTVEVAGTGREAAPKLHGAPFDLVITDRAMPEMGGDELAALVKSLTPATPVLMLTGFGDLMEAAGERPPGVDLVLSKPTTLARLRAAITTLAPDSTTMAAEVEAAPSGA